MYFKGTPLYPFGFGLSYSEFSYSDLSLKRTSDGVQAVLKVTNTSETDGDDIVQIYFGVKNSAVSRPVKKLCGFERASVRAGETAEVTINIPEHILQIYDVRRNSFITEGGEYIFYASRSSAETVIEGSLAIDGEALAERSALFGAESFDTASAVRIRWSKAFGRHFISAVGWSGTAVYGGMKLDGKTLLKIKAQSIHKKTELTIKAENSSVTIPINVSDGFDDFTVYETDITEFTGDTLEISMQEGASLHEICTE